jgi:hypothetical protein
MSQVDDSMYRRKIHQQLQMRTARNSKAPIMLPDSGVVPRFDPKLNREHQPKNVGTTGFYQYRKSRINEGSKPIGSQRFPRSVPGPTQLTQDYLRTKKHTGATTGPQGYMPRNGRP